MVFIFNAIRVLSDADILRNCKILYTDDITIRQDIVVLFLTKRAICLSAKT